MRIMQIRKTIREIDTTNSDTTQKQEELFSKENLREGLYYAAKYTEDRFYIFKAKKNDQENANVAYTCPALSNYSGSGNMIGSFSGKCYREATPIEITHHNACMQAGKYVAPPAVGTYTFKIGNNSEYVAANEINGKIEWTEEIQGILKYIKDDTPIFIFGSASQRPKTFKELKNLVK